MTIATCGHFVDEGISCSVDEGEISYDGYPVTTYGTYCWECLKSRPIETVLNSEVRKALIDAKGWKNDSK